MSRLPTKYRAIIMSGTGLYIVFYRMAPAHFFVVPHCMSPIFMKRDGSHIAPDRASQLLGEYQTFKHHTHLSIYLTIMTRLSFPQGLLQRSGFIGTHNPYLIGSKSKQKCQYTIFKSWHKGPIISLDLFKQLVRDELSVKYRGNKYRLLLERKEEVSAICWHLLAMEGQLF